VEENLKRLNSAFKMIEFLEYTFDSQSYCREISDEQEEIEKLETLEGIAFIENVKKLKGCEYFSESPSKLDKRAGKLNMESSIEEIFELY